MALIVRRPGFLGAAIGSVAAVAAVGFVQMTQAGGASFTVALQDLAEAAGAVFAAAACLRAAASSQGGLRRAWLWFAASAASWGAGEVLWSIFEVGMGQAVPFPSFADCGYVLAVPLAATGILALPSESPRATSRLRALSDASIVVIAGLFVFWVVGLYGLSNADVIGPLARVLAVGYPTGDVLLLTLIVITVRSSSALRPVFGLLAGAFALNLVADSSFAYLTLSGHYGILGSDLDTAWLAGYLLLGLAALWPVRKVAESTEVAPVRMWQLTIPWLGTGVLIGISIWTAVADVKTGVEATWIGAAFGVAFLASQVLTLNDAIKLQIRSQKAEATVRAQTTLLDQVISRAPVGILRVGTDSRVIDANPAARDIVRAPFNKRSPVADYLSPAERDRLPELVRRLYLDQTDTVEADQVALRADGTDAWLHWSVTAVRKADRTIEYFLVILEDITAKHEIEEKQKANVAELERINRLKSEFMSMVSHEFRTALTGIQGFSEILTTDEVPSEEVKEFAGDINSESLRLNRMITEMLDLDRIESGRIELHLERLDLKALIAGVVERAQMGTQRHQIVMDLDPQVPEIDADKDRMTQVVSNLLSNAVKYSPQGGEIRVAARMADGGVEISVADHGQGIPPDFIGKIFGRYERYEGAGKTQVVGTGLGLAISQQIVQLHKGRIWVESKVGEGSTFRFTIPLPQAPQAAKVA